MTTHTQAAGTSSTSVSRQLSSRSLIPRNSNTSVPAAQATGAR